MKKLINISITLLTVILLFTSCYSDTPNNPILEKNKSAIESLIKEKCNDYIIIPLKELTPFEWEKVYFFQPYALKSYIVEKVGFSWQGLHETVSEEMMQIVFVNKGELVCHIFGYPEDYYLHCDNEILYNKDNPQFAVMENSTEDINSYKMLQWFDDKLLYKSKKSTPTSNKAGKWSFKEESKVDNQLVYKNGEMVVEKDGTILGSFGYISYNGDSKIENFSGGGSLEFIGQLQGDSAVCKVENSDENIKINFKEFCYFINLTLKDDFFKLINGKKISMNGQYNYIRE
jgi:hypothetical protein